MRPTHDPHAPTAIDEAVRRFAERQASPPAAARPRPGPVAGPRRLPSWAPILGVAVAALILIGAGLALLPAPAPPALAVAAPSAPPAPVAQQAPAALPAPTPAPLAILAAGAVAYAAPDGEALGEVEGRLVLSYAERWDVSWVRAEVQGAGLVWLRMGALAGNAVDLAAIPCGDRCQPGPMTMPTATDVPYVYVAPPEPKPVVTATGQVGVPLEIAPTSTPLNIADFPTPRP